MDRETSLQVLLVAGLAGLFLLPRAQSWAGGALVDGRPARIPPGAALEVGATVRAEGVWTVVEVDLRHARLDLLGQGATADVRALEAAEAWAAAEGRSLVAVTNAGIFEPGQAPTGLFVSGGEELGALNTQAGTGNFYLEPNAVFAVDRAGTARVVDTRAWSGDPVLATQSGPALVLGGELHPLFNPDSPNRRVRSGVGVRKDDPHRVYLAISREPVRFHEMGTLFRDTLGCDDALYLDGVISGMAGPEVDPKLRAPGPFAGLLVVTTGR